MIKNIKMLAAVVVASLAFGACAKINYGENIVADGKSERASNEILKNLNEADNIRVDSLILASRVEYLRTSDVAEPHFEDISFGATESSRLFLAEYKSVLVEDITLRYEELKKTFCFPLDAGYVTSPYGWRKRRMHAGVDIKTQLGDNIYAAFDGVVRMSKYYTAFGNVVVIRHYNGLETLYAHASKLMVKVNDNVKAGDVIALSGRTGRATGTHLHFEVRVAGQYFNPELLLDVKNLTLQRHNIYITMQKGRLFASSNDSEEMRRAEIKEAFSKRYHTVRSGDTLSRIAVNNSTTVTTLCRLNSIKSTSILRLGQRIRVR